LPSWDYRPLNIELLARKLLVCNPSVGKSLIPTGFVPWALRAQRHPGLSFPLIVKPGLYAKAFFRRPSVQALLHERAICTFQHKEDLIMLPSLLGWAMSQMDWKACRYLTQPNWLYFDVCRGRKRRAKKRKENERSETALCTISTICLPYISTDRGSSYGDERLICAESRKCMMLCDAYITAYNMSPSPCEV
jgi:hypothetical protein